MGYYTDFELEASVEDIQVINDLLSDDYAFDRDFLMHDCKWYSHMEDMTKVSKRFPDILFTLTGRGENHGDLWIAYFRNGKGYKTFAQIVFPEFDKNKLT